jgi:hypothetical protein
VSVSPSNLQRFSFRQMSNQIHVNAEDMAKISISELSAKNDFCPVRLYSFCRSFVKIKVVILIKCIASHCTVLHCTTLHCTALMICTPSNKVGDTFLSVHVGSVE